MLSANTCYVSAHVYGEEELNLDIFDDVFLENVEVPQFEKFNPEMFAYSGAEIAVSAELYEDELFPAATVSFKEGEYYDSIENYFTVPEGELEFASFDCNIIAQPLDSQPEEVHFAPDLPAASIIAEPVPVATSYVPAEYGYDYETKEYVQYYQDCELAKEMFFQGEQECRKKRQLSVDNLLECFGFCPNKEGLNSCEQVVQVTNNKINPANVINNNSNNLYSLSKSALLNVGQQAIQTMKQKSVNRSNAISRWLDKRQRAKNANGEELKPNARKEATAKRVRENGRFKKVTTQWISVCELTQGKEQISSQQHQQQQQQQQQFQPIENQFEQFDNQELIFA